VTQFYKQYSIKIAITLSCRGLHPHMHTIRLDLPLNPTGGSKSLNSVSRYAIEHTLNHVTTSSYSSLTHNFTSSPISPSHHNPVIYIMNISTSPTVLLTNHLTRSIHFITIKNSSHDIMSVNQITRPLTDHFDLIDCYNSIP
jgi:hypothetical protein